MKNFIIVADSHIDNNNASAFFAMLAEVAKSDYDIIFLGDIFELWLGLNRYEEQMHKDFLSWCSKEKKNRTVGFIEGNHEFYVAKNRKEYFSWCSCDFSYVFENNIFAHGDGVNQDDLNYLKFRKISNSKLSEFIFKYIPFGKRIVHSLRVKMKSTNLEHKKYFPEDKVLDYAKSAINDNIKNIFLGHFHQQFETKIDDKNIIVLPAWQTNQEVLISKENNIKICNRKEIN